MGKTALLVLVVATTMIKFFQGEPNFACTSRGGYCSDSDTCSLLRGHVQKLSERCKCGNACCKCTDTYLDGSTCMSEGDTCDGTKDTKGCCSNMFCCTPPMTTTPPPCDKECKQRGGICAPDCSKIVDGDREYIEIDEECCGMKCCLI